VRKHRIERNHAFPTEEFRARVRTAAKERGFRTEQAFILAACENELKRDGTTGGYDPGGGPVDRQHPKSGQGVSRFQAVFTLAHCQFASERGFPHFDHQ